MSPSLKPVFWYQGLFLQPQHLQQQDMYADQQSEPFRRYQTPYFWGVSKLRINQTALQERVLEITDAELLLQDGSWISCPGNGAIPARSFKNVPLEDRGGEPFTIYLGLRRLNQTGSNVTSVDGNVDFQSIGSRFLSQLNPGETVDQHSGGAVAQVRCLDYLVKIFWSDEIENLGDYTLMPVAQLTIDGTEVRLAQEYIPPLLSVGSSDELLQLLKDLREQIISRTKVFESYKLPGGVQSSDFEAHFLPYLLVLGVLNRYLPELNHLMTAENVHPWTVYGLLRRFIGELSTFSDRVNALGTLKDDRQLVPDYDHSDLTTCFHATDRLLGELLNEILIGGGNFITLKRDADLFSAEIPGEDFDSRNIFTLVVSTTAELKTVVQSFQQNGKIAGPDDVQNLVTRALPGLPSRHRLAPPPGMPKRSDSAYFKLDHNHNHWLGVRNARSICLVWDEAPDDINIELVISKV